MSSKDARRITRVLDARGLWVRRGDGVVYSGTSYSTGTLSYGIVKDMSEEEVYVERYLRVSNQGVDHKVWHQWVPISKIMRIPILEEEVLKDEREGRR